MIVSLYCSNGRVGKTTTTLALAHEAQTNWGIKTCVLEFDFSPGDISAILGLDSARNILDAADGDFNLALQKPSDEDFHVITAGYPDYLEQLKSQDVINILTTLDKEFELVLIDIQPNFRDQMIDILNLSNKIILVITNEEQDVTRLLSNISWGVKSNYMSEEKFEILINKFNKKDKINFIEESKVTYPILATIPNIKNFKGYCDDRFGKYMSGLLNILFPELGEGENKKKKNGIFSNIFGGKKKNINTNSNVFQLAPPSNKNEPMIERTAMFLNNDIEDSKSNIIKEGKGDGDNNMLDLGRAFNNDKKEDIFALANKVNEKEIDIDNKECEYVEVELEACDNLDILEDPVSFEDDQLGDNNEIQSYSLNMDEEICENPKDETKKLHNIDSVGLNANNDMLKQVVSDYEPSEISEEKQEEFSINNAVGIDASANIFNVQEILNKFIDESNVKINDLIKKNKDLINKNIILNNANQVLNKNMLELKNAKLDGYQNISTLENDNKLYKDKLDSLQNENGLLLKNMESKDEYINSLNKELLNKESEHRRKVEEIKNKIIELNSIL